MIKQKLFQTDFRFLPIIQKYGCLYLCLYQASNKILSHKQLNDNWIELTKRGVISGDLNGDGDFDDAGEAEIFNHNAVCESFGLNVHYRNEHSLITANLDNAQIIIGKYTYKYSHFVLLDNQLKIIYNSLKHSISVEKGKLMSLRIYDKVG